MENNPSTRKWSELRGIAVVILANGSKAGTAEDFYFDPTTFQVYALRVKTGLLSHKVLYADDIRGIGQDAITTPTEEAIQRESGDDKLSSLPSGESLLSYKILSAGGNVVGTVGNILLDTSTPSTLRIAAVELTTGFLRHLGGGSPPTIPAQSIHYGEHVLMIPDEVAQSIQHS